jgi:hypothetical protein
LKGIIMGCQKCKSERVLTVGGKCDDMFYMSMGDQEYDGYIPNNLGIGGDGHIDFDYCLDCGTIQGDFPIEEVDFS